jgi:hypothetical protein
MNRFLLSDEGLESIEDGVDLADGRVEVEDGVEVDATGKLAIAAHEVGEVGLFLPRAHRMRLHGAIRVVAGKSGLDEREQEAVGDDVSVEGVQVPANTLRRHV